MTLKKFTLKNRKSLRIVGVVDQPGNTQGLAFVLHGLSGNKEQPHIVTIADAFRENQFTVVRFDSTNTFGESEGTYENMTTSGYLYDLEDVISWATSQPWYQEPFYLAGHSLGGLIVILYALQHSERVKAIAPISTVVSGRLTHDAWRKKLGTSFDNWKKTGSVIEESSSRQGLMKRLKWSFMEELLKYDVLRAVDRLSTPILLVVGENDTDTPYVHQKLLFDRLSGKKELHVIKGAPHTFIGPEHLHEVKNIVGQWISELAKMLTSAPIGRKHVTLHRWYNLFMKLNLKQNYKKYQKKTKGRKTILSFFRAFIPEIIFRTTKLEGEPVTRRMVKSICG